MQVFDLKSLAGSEEKREYVLGLKDLNTHAVYMIYGILDTGDVERKVYPGKGHEEILCIIKGTVDVIGQNETVSLSEGEAIHLHEDGVYHLKNKSDVISYYILAGGHKMEGHH
ncbi:MAG: hypothetical protein ACE5J5_04675 [Candidatus Hydrothermarchaeales archaeon]